MPNRSKHRRGARPALLAAAALLALPAAGRAADGPSYLNGAAVALPPAAAPAADGDAGLLDLYLVRRAQREAGPAERTEAVDDASAYFFDDLMPRFAQAAGTEVPPLSVLNRPVLAHVLRAVLEDVDRVSSAFKLGHPRVRPYAETAPAGADGAPLLDARGRLASAAEIQPCFTFGLAIGGSYPSGHAARGYAAALVLAEAFPDRRAELLARGARYGDNRVLCGVHHPVDVERGRALARAVFAAAAKTPAFARDVACARAEGDTGARPDAACAILRARYGTEMAEHRLERLCADLAPATPRPPACPRTGSTTAR